jgi:RecA-family ATPase
MNSTDAGYKARDPRDDEGGNRQPRERFTLKQFDSIEISDASTYLVKDILPDIGLAVIYGPEKCGKSFWIFDLLMHVALGWEYRGHDVQQGSVIYCALEGGRGFAKRIVAWRERHLIEDHDPVPFWLLDVRIELARDHLALIAAIRAQAKRPRAVIIDTLNRAINGSENNPEDMGGFIRAADAIREAFNCLVIVIHHCPLVGGRPRGHTSLSGADDVQISVEKNADNGIITVKIVHMKDDEAGLVLASKLKRARHQEQPDHVVHHRAGRGPPHFEAQT